MVIKSSNSSSRFIAYSSTHFVLLSHLLKEYVTNASPMTDVLFQQFIELFFARSFGVTKDHMICGVGEEGWEYGGGRATPDMEYGTKQMLILLNSAMKKGFRSLNQITDCAKFFSESEEVVGVDPPILLCSEVLINRLQGLQGSKYYPYWVSLVLGLICEEILQYR
eukprot:gene23739-biopygen9602